MRIYEMFKIVIGVATLKRIFSRSVEDDGG